MTSDPAALRIRDLRVVFDGFPAAGGVNWFAVAVGTVTFVGMWRWNWGVVLAAFMVVSWVADYWASHATSRPMQAGWSSAAKISRVSRRTGAARSPHARCPQQPR